MTWGWVKGWGHALAGSGGVIGNGFGAAVDFAINDDMSDAHDDWNQMLGDVGKTIHGVGQGMGVLGPPIGWALQKDYELYSDYVSRPISAAVTASSIASSSTYRKRLGHQDNFAGEWATMFDPAAWQEGWKIAKHRSPGEAIAYAITTDDIANQHDMEDAERHWWFHLLSGGIDATTSTVMDPLYFAAKVGRLGRVGTATKSLDTTLAKMGTSREVVRGTPEAEEASNQFLEAIQKGSSEHGNLGPNPDVPAFADPARRTPMGRTLVWMERESKRHGEDRNLAARVIEKHPMLRDSAKGGLIASLMARADYTQKGLIMRVALGDGSAYHALDETRPALALQLQQLYDMRKDYAAVETAFKADNTLLNPVEKATNANRLQTVNREIDDLETRERWLDDVIGTHGTTNPGIRGALDQIPKGGLYPTLANASAVLRGDTAHYTQRAFKENFHFYNPFNSPVRVIHSTAGRINHFVNGERPAGWLDTNDPEGWRELDRTLAQAKGFSPQARNAFVTSYMGATSEAEKLAIAKDAEEAVIRHVADRHGIAGEDAHDVLNSAVKSFFWQRDQMRATVQNRAYSGAMDDGRRIDFVDAENTPTTIHPLLATQLANKIPLVDVKAVERAFGRNGNALRAWAGKNVRDPAVDAGDFLSAWWKTTSLMRLGYMVRVLGDDEMAYMAKLGAMTAIRPYGRGASNFVLNRTEQNLIRARNTASHIQDFRSYFGARAGNVADQALRARGYSPLDLAMRRTERMTQAPERPWMPKDRTMNMRRLGQESRDVTLESGTKVNVQGWAPRGDVGEYWRNLSSEDRLFLDSAEDTRLRAMRTEWSKGLVNRGEADFYPSWAHALNTQLGKDDMARLLLGGAEPGHVVDWLKRTPEGRAYQKRLPLRALDPERWADNIDTFVNHYAPTPELRAAALNGTVSTKDLKKIDDALTPTQVHGPMLSYNQGKGAAAEVMNGFRQNFYKYLNQIPTDVLVRHPLTKALYEDHLDRNMNRFQRSGGQITDNELRAMENQARSYAANEANKVVLDLTTNSNAAHVFRFVAPFYNAWDKALKRWGRLLYGNPELLFRGNRLWQGSNNIPIAVDDMTHRGGDVEDANGKTLYSKDKNAFTGLSHASEQLLTFRMPKWMAKKLGVNDVFDEVQIPKSSLNLILQGDPWYLPGFGPMVQIPASKLAMDKPKYAEMMKTILPYGPKSFKDLVEPTALHKFNTWQDTEDSDYAAAQINIWRTKYTRWMESGKQGPAPDFNDPQIKKDAKRLQALRFFSQMVLPVNARYQSPYKFYLDQYHKLMLPPDQGGVGPEKARDAFIQKYPDYFLFAESVSQNNSQLPPTVEAWNASKKYKDLLAETPDIAPAVIGSAALGGNFNDAVYSAQFGQRLSPSSSKTGREHRDLATFAQDALANEGWRQFKKVNDLVRVVLNNRQLESVQQSGAEDLKAVKALAVQTLKDQYPQWYEDYSAFNPQKQESTINQLTALATSDKTPAPRRAPGGDIYQLRNYLGVRDQFLAELAARKRGGGSGDIRANSNEDLQQAWEYQRDRLAGGNTVFSDVIYDRYLSNDDWLRA